VKTTDGKDGWVSLRSIRVIASPSASEPAMDPETVNANGPVKCDDTLWTHVYHPSRLIVKQPCIAVTGTIVDATNGGKADGVRHEADGDAHGWLKVDPQFANLLKSGKHEQRGRESRFRDCFASSFRHRRPTRNPLVRVIRARPKYPRSDRTWRSSEPTFGIPITPSGWKFTR
jgi:hypothetical protein